jgi:iron-sulfur cluster repair protein YtfE (RIC family)
MYPAAAVDAADPVSELMHDHEDLNLLVRDIGELVRGDDPAAAIPALAAQLVELREHLFLHFAREEEGLFPYVASGLPDLEEEVAAMVSAHDTVCGAVARMIHAAQAGDPAPLATLFERFEMSYTLHARAERALLQRLADRLSSGQRAELVLLLRGL